MRNFGFFKEPLWTLVGSLCTFRLLENPFSVKQPTAKHKILSKQLFLLFKRKPPLHQVYLDKAKESASLRPVQARNLDRARCDCEFHALQ